MLDAFLAEHAITERLAKSMLAYSN